ncbi:MAG: hypothetical protein PHW35_04600 [Lentimicrobiaceae bacterium]|nr:hypothetical protein [Lentimicrobiaceae bacterium]MDD4597228.1 hypothetical protein [Lentimicrobiaceae bacterium]
MLRRISVLLFLLIYTFSLSAQNPNIFSDDPEVFIEDLASFMASSKDKVAREAIKTLKDRWVNGEVAPGAQKEIIRTSNLMLAQNMRPTPAFRDYLEAVNTFRLSGLPHSIIAWHKGLQPFIDTKLLRQLSIFFENTVNLNKKNTIFRSYGNSWQFRKGSYSYDYDTTLVVKLSKVDLVCITGRDSIRIHETSGTHYPLKDIFVGYGGKVYWEAVKLDPQKIYALIQSYSIDLKITAWSADTVNFYHKGFFNFPLTGSLEDRVLVGVPTDKATFPRFTSYQTDIEISPLYKDIYYRGGFTLEGARIIGSGYGNRDAVVWIKRQGSPFIKLASRSFVINPERMISQRASATIYYEADSIFHPGIQVRYMDKDRELMLIRSGEGATASPFFNSYHKVDMYFEALYYTIGSDNMSLEMLRGIRQQGDAFFESSSYYSLDRYRRMQGIDEINPLNVIYNFSNSTKRKVFYLSELIEFMQKPAEQVKAMVLNLSNGGYIIYNIDNERIEVVERLTDYLMARSKKKDYDVIQIQSQVTRTSNAELNLKTFDLKIKGVSQVSLSDSQAVYIYPRDHEILLRKNRDFVFTGLVRAGYFDFYANESSFEYDKFKLNMPQIDSITFKVDTVSKKDKKLSQVRVKNVLANLSGELMIDDPANKSGIQNLPVYPVFISKNDAYVYYDQPRVEKGVYNRDKFYYTVDPFVLDSLNSFTTEGLKFNGYLYSDGILPEIREPLKVMDDYSLGFNRQLGKEGIPVYDGRATFYSKLALSNRGLDGSGTLKYLTSTSESKRFMFYPDSLVAILDSFNIAQSTDFPAFPEVTGVGVNQRWLPKMDVMRLSTLPGKEFAMFNGKSFHSGVLSLTTAGLLGKGKTRFDNADLTANTFVFSTHSFTSDTTAFRLYYPERPSLSFAADVYPGRVDFTRNFATFGTPGNSVRINLPLSRYICYMDKIEWRMKDDELYLTNSLASRAALSDTINLTDLVDFDFTGSAFISTDPARDSLQFFAMEATYRMKENVINAREVKMIRVADAAIFPGNGEVTILSDGNMQPLTNATIIADRKQKYHRIYNASAEVKTRHDYTASGYVDYADSRGTIQPVYFGNIRVDDAGQTIGRALIKPEDQFELNAHFRFTGMIDLLAAEQFMNFSGAYQINDPCNDGQSSWVTFSTFVNPQKIQLPVSPVMKDTLGDPVFVALVYSDFFSEIYPAFYQKPKAWGDTIVASANGWISYDAGKERFIITEAKDVANNTSPAMELDTRQCILTATGKIETGAGLGQVNVRSFGKAIQFMPADSTRFELGMAINFFFADQAMNKLSDALRKSELTGTDVNGFSYQSLLNGILGQNTARDVTAELNLSGQLKRPPAELSQRLLLTGLNMVWDPNLKSMVSEGEFGLAGVNGNLVNRKVNGYVEIGKRRTGDIINIYLEISNDQWYFFSYGSNFMQAISSDNDFNAIIAELKEDKRIQKSGNGEAPYQYIIGTPERRIAFLRKMQSRQQP